MNDLKKFFGIAGLKDEDIDKAIADYYRYVNSEMFSFNIRPDYKDLQAKNIKTDELQEEELVKDMFKRYISYIETKNDIAQAYQKSKDWNKVFSSHVYQEPHETAEAFIDYLEEIYQEPIETAKQLQEITRINQPPDKRTKITTIEGLEDILIIAHYTKFFRALEKAIKEGAKYKDLLKIKPGDYRLPETWELNDKVLKSSSGHDQYSSILWAIGMEFSLEVNLGVIVLPSLRNIAKDLEAPYSVLMDAFNLMRI